ncbi:acyl-CoA thioesterase [Streptomonospora wellingtoniae]|uniref:Thioesterase family protein n=1 Tax=Streptomonospora wellingtoniae TaxID=3075544 RepID=A0ABU2KQ28_9ACTN|nr:thioesterase family protein [Streptomonospora sp. DSM 45055]MDT0301238.1 thioesterase family protein [Streptomonospora sp. DSM 45055]
MVEAVTQADASKPGRGQRPHVFHAQVRFADLDPLNHVNNVRMLTYLEDARIAFLRPDFGTEGGSPFGGLVVARHEIDYLRPILLRSEPLRVETRVTEVRNASFRLAYQICDDDHVYARAVSVLVGYDVQGQAIRRLDQAERDYLDGFLLTEAEF